MVKNRDLGDFFSFLIVFCEMVFAFVYARVCKIVLKFGEFWHYEFRAMYK